MKLKKNKKLFAYKDEQTKNLKLNRKNIVRPTYLVNLLRD